METLSFEELKELAIEIKNEIRSKKNTSQRIGYLFYSIVEKMEEVQKEIDKKK